MRLVVYLCRQGSTHWGVFEVLLPHRLEPDSLQLSSQLKRVTIASYTIKCISVIMSTTCGAREHSRAGLAGAGGGREDRAVLVRWARLRVADWDTERLSSWSEHLTL